MAKIHIFGRFFVLVWLVCFLFSSNLSGCGHCLILGFFVTIFYMFDHRNVFHMFIFSLLIFQIQLLYYLHRCINTSEIYHGVSSSEADCKIAQVTRGCMQGLIGEALKPRMLYIIPPQWKLDLPQKLKVNCSRGSHGMEKRFYSTSEKLSYNIYNPVPSAE